MKKTLYILAAAVLALSSCSKGADIVGGNNNYSSTAGGSYMMNIADNLMAGALEDLEIALDMGKTEITWASHFSGMTIIKDTGNTWKLSFEGPFAFDGVSYPTSFAMTATRLNENKHADWDVIISGQRTEREGYSCQFESVGAITYRCTTPSNSGWNMLYGRLSMIVYNRYGKQDGCLLTFDGAPSQAIFMRGL